MDIRELRIGNWVYNGFGEPVRVSCICGDTNVGGYSLSTLKPIKLTPELMERCGFESNPYQDRYELGDIWFEYCAIRGMIWNEKYPHVKHLHTLQNLIHSLTGSELEVKW